VAFCSNSYQSLCGGGVRHREGVQAPVQLGTGPRANGLGGESPACHFAGAAMLFRNGFQRVVEVRPGFYVATEHVDVDVEFHLLRLAGVELSEHA